MDYRSNTRDLRISGHPADGAHGWSDDRIARWIRYFLGLGVALRLLRVWLDFPLWNDEAYVVLNVLERDFAGLMKPLDYAQVCPLLFLWAEKAITLIFGYDEIAFRLLPTIGSIANLFLFRHVAGRLLKGDALCLAVAFVAVGFSLIRYGGEVKPYATDFFMALALIALALEWFRRPDRTYFLWGLAALAPLAIGISNPAIFIVGSVGLVLPVPVLRSKSPSAIAAIVTFGVLSMVTFQILLRHVNGPQSDHVMSWMSVYWAGAFPPRSFVALASWLAEVHTSNAFAYPGGGDHGASSLTTTMVLVAILAYLRRGPMKVLAVLLTPFVLGLIAAAMHRYPYGGSARTMQYVAPSINLMAGLGGAAILARIPQAAWRDRVIVGVFSSLLAIGAGMMAWDIAFPYKTWFFQSSRSLARHVWTTESKNAELVCARVDLRLPLNAFRWQQDREVSYLCHRAIYGPRTLSDVRPRYELITATHPLRVVMFNETRCDARMMATWLESHSSEYMLRDRREYKLDQAFRRGKSSVTDRYVIYEMIPRESDGKRSTSSLVSSAGPRKAAHDIASPDRLIGSSEGEDSKSGMFR